jgi:single stranded DNA-binding protein
MVNINPNNNVTIQGRLGQDPILRRTTDRKPVLNLSVAVSNDRFSEETQEWVPAEPTWVSVTVWNDAAERYASHLGKGALVRVMGRLTTRKRTISKEVTVGSGKSAKKATAEFEVTETYITASSVQIIPPRNSAANAQVPYQAAAVPEPDF